MPKPLVLSDHTINAVNALVTQHGTDLARELKGAAPPSSALASAAAWFGNFGLGLSTYLPYLYQTWQALAAKGVSGLPSVQVFAAEFDLIVNGPTKTP